MLASGARPFCSRTAQQRLGLVRRSPSRYCSGAEEEKQAVARLFVPFVRAARRTPQDEDRRWSWTRWWRWWAWWRRWRRLWSELWRLRFISCLLHRDLRIEGNRRY